MHETNRPAASEAGGKPALGGWTVKGVPPDDRAMMNAAAQRANMQLGPWLVETVRLRVARERKARLFPPAPPSLALPQLVALIQELPALSQAKKCGGVALALRRLVAAELAARMPRDALAIEGIPNDQAWIATPLMNASSSMSEVTPSCSAAR